MITSHRVYLVVSCKGTIEDIGRLRLFARVPFQPDQILHANLIKPRSSHCGRCRYALQSNLHACYQYSKDSLEASANLALVPTFTFRKSLLVEFYNTYKVPYINQSRPKTSSRSMDLLIMKEIVSLVPTSALRIFLR